MLTWFGLAKGLANISWLVFLCLSLKHFWQDRQLLKQARFWLITPGKISSFSWACEKHQLWATIVYDYKICDFDFQGHYFFLDTTHNNPNSRYARKVIYRAAIAFQQEKDIDVFYNPNHPNQSALDVGIPLKLNSIIGLLVFLLLLHLLMVIYHW
jgi:hypothetical protein